MIENENKARLRKKGKEDMKEIESSPDDFEANDERVLLNVPWKSFKYQACREDYKTQDWFVSYLFQINLLRMIMISNISNQSRRRCSLFSEMRKLHKMMGQR